MLKHLIIIIISCFLLLSCHKEIPDYSFYYWRTEFSLKPKEQEVLQKSKGETLFLRFFDVVKQDGKFQPVGIISVKNSQKISKKIVPVVFITNQTWYGITKEEIEFLAQKIFENIEEIGKSNHFSLTQEIQIDSDWTEKTKIDYFKFLETLAKISKKNITCTLRLHQIKDKNSAGIPPVKKGYLMCYATSSPLDYQPKNSILDFQTLKRYLVNIDKYPLEFDIALPIYSWGIVRNHFGKTKIINALTNADLENNQNFKKIDVNSYEILHDDFYFGMFLNKGFTIKIEEISEKTLLQTLDFLDTKIADYSVVYYHLDEKFTQNYPNLIKPL